MNTTRPKPAVAAAGLRKTCGTRTVLDGVDLLVPQGGVFCLLGEAGAGKTTVVRLLSALTAPDGGELRVAGHDVVRAPASVRAAVGLCGLTAVDGSLTVEENLLRTADLHRLGQDDGRSRAADLIERFDLVDVAGAPAARCRRGERRRLELAMAVVGLPPVLLLDEPTAGLDPGDRRAVRRIVRQLADAGVTVFLATRSRAEAAALADRVAVLHGGRLVAGNAGRRSGSVPWGDGGDAGAGLLRRERSSQVRCVQELTGGLGVGWEPPVSATPTPSSGEYPMWTASWPSTSDVRDGGVPVSRRGRPSSSRPATPWRPGPSAPSRRRRSAAREWRRTPWRRTGCRRRRTRSRP